MPCYWACTLRYHLCWTCPVAFLKHHHGITMFLDMFHGHVFPPFWTYTTVLPMSFEHITMVLACFFFYLMEIFYIYHDNTTVLNIYSGITMFLNMSHGNVFFFLISRQYMIFTEILCFFNIYHGNTKFS